MGVVIGLIAGVSGAMLVGRLIRGYDQGWIVSGLAGLLGGGLALAALGLPGAHGLAYAPQGSVVVLLTQQALAGLVGGAVIQGTVGFLRDLLLK
ncbi:hypothetical protein [Sagittula sp. S175]|uniref:hypothetical protein n=1 Tax=Sagittula sp. S175 TaxID=3415129 RepID=UPI003C7B904C